MATLSTNQKALLTFIRERHAATGQPVTHGEMVEARVIPSRSLTATRASLMGRGLLRVTSPGVGEWWPVEVVSE